MAYIQNISLEACKTAQHVSGDVLIQITDPCHAPPKPAQTFKEIYQFEFLDVDPSVDNFAPEFAMSKEDGEKIYIILSNALANGHNVIVHCHAGICRSGAVAEVGIAMGFSDTGKFRAPNLHVKRELMKFLRGY